MSKPFVISKIEDELRAGRNCFIVGFNTGDRLYDDKSVIPPLRLQQYLYSYYMERGYSLFEFTDTWGMIQVKIPGSKDIVDLPNHFRGNWSQDPGSYLSPLREIMRDGDPRKLFIFRCAGLKLPYAENNNFLMPENRKLAELLYLTASDEGVRKTQNILILLEETSQSHPLLSKDGFFRRIEAPLPDSNTRKSFTEYLLKQEKAAHNFGNIPPDMEKSEFINLTNGLRLIDVEALFRHSAGSAITRKSVMDYKTAAINELAHGLLEIIPANVTFNQIAGQDNAKKLFKKVANKMRKGRTDANKMILLMGIPGTGKSLIVKALAHELSLPLVKLKSIKSPYVGESQRNLELVIQMLESISPVICLIEEVDQRFARNTGSSGDSGTSEELFARFLDYIGGNEIAGKVLFVATTNRPDVIPEALIDRASLRIPFLHPTRTELQQMIPLITESCGRKLENDFNLEELVKHDAFKMTTGRVVTETIIRAADFADNDNDDNQPIKIAHMRAAAEDVISKHVDIEYEFIALTAIQAASFQSLIPIERDINDTVDIDSLPYYLHGLIEETGRINLSKLNEKLQLIKQQRFAERTMR